ncbi:MAG: YitT family protein [Oscillospiraceae bacterium]|nr:YitT family protein [Oscillospiraceae bacterium]
MMVIGIYFFKFPNNFCFGGVTGIAVLFSGFLKMSASDITFIINMLMLVAGFIFLGKGFGVKTVYVSVMMSVALSVLQKVYPMSKPLTNEPVLEFMFAVFLPALGSAMLFDMDASSGGTDILAMILKKYTTMNIGATLMLVDVLITVAAFIIYGPKTGLFSFAGLLSKSLVIDSVIENLNLCKYFTVICDDPEPICDYIHKELKRSATVFSAEGSYLHNRKKIVLTVMRRSQAVLLRRFIRKNQPQAFIMITNSSEIIGKGFRGTN